MDRLAPITKLDPSTRLICLALISSASLLARGLFALALAAILLILLIRAGNSRAAIIRNSACVAIFALFAGGMRNIGAVSERSWWEILTEIGSYGARLLAVVLASRLFYITTSISEIRDAVTRIARHVPILRRIDVGLGLSMVIGFIPLIFVEWAGSLEAARSRAMPRRPNLSQLTVFISAFLRRLMLQAVNVPESLRARGWSKDRGITELKWNWVDTLALVVCSAMLAAAALHLV